MKEKYTDPIMPMFEFPYQTTIVEESLTSRMLGFLYGIFLLVALYILIVILGFSQIIIFLKFLMFLAK